MNLADKTGIIGQLWIEFRDDSDFSAFMEYNDIGCPMAYMLAEGLVVELSKVGEDMVNETFNMFINLLGITEEEIDETDDSSLLDPAQGAFNYQAPGATRFQLTTTLAKRTLDSSDESSFFEVIRLVDGVKTKEIDYPIYSEIEKTLARRTYEESGNYTIDPFVISLDDGDAANGKNDIFRVNNNFISANLYFSDGENGSATGPLTVNTGYLVQINTGARVVII